MPKIELTEEQYELLKDLQNELNTQDNRCTANPLYGVMTRRKIWGIDSNYSDDFEWYIDTETYDDEEIKEYLVESYSEEILTYVKEKNLVDEDELKEGDEYIQAKVCLDTIDGYEFDDLITELIPETYKVFYRYEERIHNNSFSLFEKDAFDHIKLNGHNISGQHWSYAFSNQRTPRMEKLRELLKNIELGE